MRLQIKTLNQKSILVEIEDTKTVYDLKKELSLYPDVGVRPELQKLIYAGRILANEDELTAYNIDVRKFLVVMILKQPLEGESPSVGTTSKASGNTATPPTEPTSTALRTPTPTTTTTTPAAATAPAQQQQEQQRQSTPLSSGGDVEAAAGSDERSELVQQIVGMGYPEIEVRRALAASFYNPERAIEYLIEGIPTEPSTPEGSGFADFSTEDTADLSPFEIFRSDPLFRNLRRAIQQHPELIDDAIQRVGEANPAILSLIQENQQEFLSMLIEGSEDDFDDEDDESS